MLWVLICTVHLTVCSYHVMYVFQSESTLCLNVKELLAQNSCDIWSLSDWNGTWTHSHLVRKWTLNHLDSLWNAYFNKVSNLYFWTYWRNSTQINRLNLNNFIDIALRHGCSPKELLHIFRTPFPKNTYGALFLTF